MNYRKQIAHTIQPGDSLYKIAKRFDSTISKILTENPHINPDNLRVATVLSITPGEFSQGKPINELQLILSNDMREAWEEHVMWTRLLIISIVDNLHDTDEVTERILQNPSTIAGIFQPYYGNEVAEKIRVLLTEHLVIAKQLVTALKNNDTAAANDANTRWYKNADDMAAAFSSINPYYDKMELQQMLHQHLDLTKQEVAMRLAGNYSADIAAYDRIQQQALEMADYFTLGIVKQFPDMFR